MISATHCLPGRYPVSVRTGPLQLTNRNGANIDTHRHPSSTILAEATFILCLSRELIRILDSIVFISSHIELNHVDSINGNSIQEFDAVLSSECCSHIPLRTPKPRPVNTSLVAPTSPSRSTAVLGAEVPCAV
ncbi:hypothetical protein FIBSPDRAFT_872269 [Athelia psychrophila]|uniref:Uncharacterized protein n=1 Tax=Athelia psychrophila TaxID=1759441 RepID=A0A165ZQ71_9AGAM|nr:hypothetical protein FIBSPDRAFT_872269 [Fibularhizoctonia sp. CBS 109695]